MFFENINDGFIDMFLTDQRPNPSNDVSKFLRGNMFDNEFIPYKGMSYLNPKLKSQREKDLFEIMKASFEINDYNLYLDLNPQDTVILSRYKMAAKKLENLTESFEKKYGPLCIDSADYENFKWIDNPWPWDKEDSKYV